MPRLTRRRTDHRDLLHRLSIDDLFFFNDTATTEIYTLSLHDALPICVVGIGLPHDFRKTDDGRWVAVAVVEEHLVPDPHLPHEVAGLVVAHPIPVVGRVLRLHQVIKAEGGGLRLHQPVAPGTSSTYRLQV